MNNDPTTPNPQPVQPQQPQPQPVMQQPVYGQPMAQPYTQPMQPGYAQPQPTPKPPMDPKKKKAIITWCCVGGGVLVLGIAAAIILPIILRVDYSTAYQAVKDLKSPIQDLSYTNNCDYVDSYLNSEYTSAKTYGDYIESCKKELSSSDLVNKLGETEGVKRNNDIKNQYDSFKTLYDSVVPNQEDLSKKLDIYSTWHSFVVAVGDLSYSDSTDAEITTAANYLINSGNETLKKYGEGWLEKTLAAATAQRNYDNKTSWYGEEYDQLKAARDNARTEQSNYVSANKPDVASLYPLNLENTSKVYAEFQNLYDLISDTYEDNYFSDNGDCLEFLGEVVCD